MTEWKMFLQAYVRADDYAAAFRVAERLIDLTAPLARTADCHVSPYDKFEDQYGVWLSLEAPDKPAAWLALQAALATGWHVGGDETDRHAVWDVRNDGPCPIAEARWLNLELYATDEPEDGDDDAV